MTTVISHYSALRAIRRGRRVYSVLPWEPVSAEDQSQILANAVPGKAKVDLEELLILDAWDKDSDPVDLLLSSSANRRVCPHAVQHVLSPKLPPGSIRHVKADIYATSPAFTALLCSKGASVAKTLMLLMELLGAYSLPPETTPFIRYDEIWPHREQDALEPRSGPNGLDADTGLDDAVEHAAEPASETEFPACEQTHYSCEPAATLEELEAVASYARSSTHANFRTAVKLARAGSASPAESLMFAVLGAPMRFGGFGCCSLPKGGLLLNHRIDFTADAVHMSSGIPYAVCDLFCPAAQVDNEYNGIGHELENARVHDGNRNNGLKAMGIHVLVINKDQMRDIVALEAFARTMHRFAGVQFRYRIKAYRKRQAAWLNALRAGIGLPPV